jgi:uncharacterized protein (DUF362 family)
MTPPDPIVDRRPEDARSSRRTFVRQLVATGLAVASSPTAILAGTSPLTADDLPKLLSTHVPRARVARRRIPEALEGSAIIDRVVHEAIRDALVRLTDTAGIGEAWGVLLRTDDVVGIKFNRSGQSGLATTPVVAAAVLESLIETGWPPTRIVCIEAPPEIERRYGTVPALEGYDTPVVDFGSGTDRFARVLNQVTALIDVPFLKTHNIMGMTCCLKNLSHGLTMHPGRYHAAGGAPSIPDIVGVPLISAKLRLCLVDGLRVVMDGGPDPSRGLVQSVGLLLAGTDPVATDTLGLYEIDLLRSEAGLNPIRSLNVSAGGLPFLAAAHRKGLGVALPQRVDVLDPLE